MRNQHGFIAVPIVLCLMFSGCAAPAASPTPPPADTPTQENTPTPTPIPSSTPTPHPTATLSPDDALRAMIVNPIGDITYVHDPTMIKDGDTYYLYSTGDNIPIRCSADMKIWTSCGSVFRANLDWVVKAVPGVTQLWAPDIVFHDGKYYLYYASSTMGSNGSAIGLATNTTLDPANPAYAWVDQGMVVSSQKTTSWDLGYNAIDPNLTFDKDGQPWLVYGSWWSVIAIEKVDPATMKPAAGEKVINVAAQPSPHSIEGAFITQRGDYYYLFASHDLCCKGVDSTYNIRVGRSKSITGPYLDQAGKPLTQGGGTMVYKGSTRWRGPGHNSIYIEGDTYYMVYHSYDADAAGAATLRIEALQWDADGWPQSPSALLGI